MAPEPRTTVSLTLTPTGSSSVTGEPHISTSANIATQKLPKTVNKWSRNGYGEPALATGKFSPEESATIRDAIIRYCESRNIEPARLCSECEHRAELKGAWMEIARCLPDRSVQAVYRHGLRQLHPFKRGPWSEEECMMLLELVARLGKRWALIQAKINRSADSCRDKHREIGQNSEYIRGRWTNDEQKELMKVVWEFCCKTFPHVVLRKALVDDSSNELVTRTNSASIKADIELVPENVPENLNVKMLGRVIEEYGRANPNVSITIPWSTISKKMGNRSRLSCFKKWQKLTGVTSSNAAKERALERQFASGKALAMHAQEHGVQATIQASQQAKMSMTSMPTVMIQSQKSNFVPATFSHGYSTMLTTNKVEPVLLVKPNAVMNTYSNSLEISIAERQRAWKEKQAFNQAVHQFGLNTRKVGSDPRNAEDVQLLEKLASMNVHNSNDILWNSIQHSQGALNSFLRITAEERVDNRSVTDAAKEILNRWRFSLQLV